MLQLIKDHVFQKSYSYTNVTTPQGPKNYSHHTNVITCLRLQIFKVVNFFLKFLSHQTYTIQIETETEGVQKVTHSAAQPKIFTYNY